MPDDIASVGAVGGEGQVEPIVESPEPASTVKPETKQVEDPFESLSEEDLVKHPRLSKLIQSRSDRIVGERLTVQQRQAQANAQVSQLDTLVSQLRSGDPQEIVDALTKQVEEHKVRQTVGTQATQEAAYRYFSNLVQALHQDLGSLSDDEAKVMNPEQYPNQTAFIQAYANVKADRIAKAAVEKATKKIAAEEREAAEAQAKSKERQGAVVQEVGQGVAGSAAAVDLSDLRGTGRLHEAFRRDREARNS